LYKRCLDDGNYLHKAEFRGETVWFLEQWKPFIKLQRDVILSLSDVAFAKLGGNLDLTTPNIENENYLKP